MSLVEPHGRCVCRADIYLAGHDLRLASECTGKIIVQGGSDSKPACVRRNGYAVDVAEVAIILTKPAVVLTFVVNARTKADQEPGETTIDAHSTKIERLLGEPTDFLEVYTTDMRYRRLVQRQCRVKVCFGDIGYLHRGSVPCYCICKTASGKRELPDRQKAELHSSSRLI